MQHPLAVLSSSSWDVRTRSWAWSSCCFCVTRDEVLESLRGSFQFRYSFTWRVTLLSFFFLHEFQKYPQNNTLYGQFFSQACFKNNLFLIIYLYTYFFLLYSMVTQLHIHVHILFSHTIMLHHKWLDIVPSATQQDPIANPSQRQHSASIYPKLPVPPTPSPSPLATTSLFSKSMIFFSVERFLCAIYYIPDISDIIWYLSFSFWFTSLRTRVSSSIYVAANGIILFFSMAG